MRGGCVRRFLHRLRTILTLKLGKSQRRLVEQAARADDVLALLRLLGAPSSATREKARHHNIDVSLAFALAACAGHVRCVRFLLDYGVENPSINNDLALRFVDRPHLPNTFQHNTTLLEIIFVHYHELFSPIVP